MAIPYKSLHSSKNHRPGACQATVTFDAFDDGMSDSFNASDYSKAVQVKFSGYSGSELANFPVLVKLSTAISGFKYSDFALPNGGDLSDWSKAKLVPMENVSKDGLWKPVSNMKSGSGYPAQMFFKYTVEVQ